MQDPNIPNLWLRLERLEKLTGHEFHGFTSDGEDVTEKEED